MKCYHRWLLNRRIKRAQRLLVLIDAGVKRVGMPRQMRRSLWRDFINGKIDRTEIFDLIKVK